MSRLGPEYWPMLHHQLLNNNNNNIMSRLGPEYWLGSEIFAESSLGGQLTMGYKNERIPIDHPMPIQTYFGDGSVINKNKL